MKIYRANDVIKLNVGGLKVGVSPLTFAQKMDIQAEIETGGTKGAMKGAALAVRYALRSIEGLEDAAGKAYKLKRDEGVLTEDCWNDLQNIPQAQDLIMVCLNLLESVPSEFKDPNTGRPLEGVSLVKEKAPRAKKR